MLHLIETMNRIIDLAVQLSEAIIIIGGGVAAAYIITPKVKEDHL